MGQPIVGEWSKNFLNSNFLEFLKQWTKSAVLTSLVKYASGVPIRKSQVPFSTIKKLID